VLAYYDPRKPTVLQADCSETACAAVLMQDGRPSYSGGKMHHGPAEIIT